MNDNFTHTLSHPHPYICIYPDTSYPIQRSAVLRGSVVITTIPQDALGVELQPNTLMTLVPCPSFS
ncbi:hypothetical protein M413DRAFT_162197 [Hebeloma cylindrosporum]|uniref:Uncharacterized protein n=1 Tax=Hebeloma cylindrosporum TaxID=76867 RepID=A0A0C3C8C3_HEBCY|nr:hypothetical protein M413DRAFT_162197 [Hebeloma cylindrosporum h7]